ncbi:extracellular metalloprotease [Scenedesmus sp. PABB004]|nr:extracellular metalloprotease [Scenedesmus sp. PABB004]
MAAPPQCVHTRVTFAGPHGAPLAGVLCSPAGAGPGGAAPPQHCFSARDAAVLVHGFASHKDGFHLPAIAERLATLGLASLRFDEPEQIAAAVAFLEGRGQRVVLLLGHSRGAITSTLFAGRHARGGVALLVLVSGRLDLSLNVTARYGGDALARLDATGPWPQETRRDGDGALLRWALTAEDLRERLALDMRGACTAIGARRPRPATLVLHGSADPICEAADAAALAASILEKLLVVSLRREAAQAAAPRAAADSTMRRALRLPVALLLLATCAGLAALPGTRGAALDGMPAPLDDDGAAAAAAAAEAALPALGELELAAADLPTRLADVLRWGDDAPGDAAYGGEEDEWTYIGALPSDDGGEYDDSADADSGAAVAMDAAAADAGPPGALRRLRQLPAGRAARLAPLSPPAPLPAAPLPAAAPPAGGAGAARAATAAAASAAAARPPAGGFRRCETDEGTPEQRGGAERHFARQAAARAAGAARSGLAAASAPIIIPGVVGAGQVAEQVAVLNAAFAPAGVTFALASATQRSASLAVFTTKIGSAQEAALKQQLRLGGAATLNVWTWGPAGDPTNNALLGWSTFPANYAAAPARDGVVVRWSALPGGPATNYNQGDTVVHEVGHWLGLYHTFQGGCARSGTAGGDFVADTPAEASGAAGCPVGRDSCAALPGLDPIDNFMDYSYDACMLRFTPGQAARMAAQWAVYRAGK